MLFAIKKYRLAGRIALLVLLGVEAGFPNAQAADAQGTVFHDRNHNGILDEGEPGVPDVLVSNQIELTRTDAEGRWRLPVAGEECIFFVIKPAEWATPYSDQNLPRFYYIHKPKGSPSAFKHPGVAPTGALPEAIDFPLYPNKEPGKFQAVFFGDPQPRDQKELDYIAHDVVEELIGTDAAFGVTLGDILFDDLSLFENNNRLISLIGIPWHNVIGNHDINYQAADDASSDETYERFFGPSYYAFEYGPVWFVVLDNILWGGKEPEGTGKYTGGLGPEQLRFLQGLIPQIPRNQLILFMMHIPLYGVDDRESLFRLIEDRPYTMSISGHTHWHGHFFLDEQSGWKGDQPHHHIVNVTVCGTWWAGEPDEIGIPHTMMRDGAPNGYSLITFDGQSAVVDFKVARRPADYQMNVHAPEMVPFGKTEETVVYVNVFNGSEKSKVDMKVGRGGSWIRLEKVYEEDPYYLKLKENETKQETLLGRELSDPVKSHHLWKGRLPRDLTLGVHPLSVKTEDMYGRVYKASRTFRVE